MQKPEELVEKITKEEQSLDAKLHNLEYFMMSEDFIKVSPEQKTLLEQQHKVMTEYKLILIKRAHRINWEAGRDKAAAEIKEATESKKTCRTCKWNKPVEVKGEWIDNCSERSRMIDIGANNCWEAKEERLEPHVFAAMEYEAWKKKEQERKERIPDEVCRACKYYNAKDDICTNRSNKDGKCWEPEEQEYPRCPFKDGNTIPKCINLRGDKCSSPDTICYKSARIPKKEEEDGTPSDK